MNTAKLFATCRERYQRQPDPNVIDENASFVAVAEYMTTTAQPTSQLVEWRARNAPAKLRPAAGTVLSYRAVSTKLGAYALMPLRATSGVEVERGYYCGTLGDMAYTASGELYVRLIIGVANNMRDTWALPSATVLLLRGADDTERLRLELLWDGEQTPKTWGYRLTVRSRNDKTYTVEIPDVAVALAWHDIKIQIPRNGPAVLSVAPELNGSALPIPRTATNLETDGVGFKDAGGTLKVALASEDGTTSSRAYLPIMRVGIGNKISTALP